MTSKRSAGRVGSLAGAACLIIASAARADIVYVDDSAVSGANDGSSWANAFTDLQDALKTAQAGDEIRIGQGVYKPAPPDGDRAISFNLVSGVVMQGGYGGFGGFPANLIDPVKFPTVLSGDINNTPHLPYSGCNQESHHVIRAESVATGTQLRGCIIQRGCALAVPEFEEQRGGGLRVEGTSALTIADCVIRDHWARFGGGAYVSSDSVIHFQRCRFINNRLPTGSTFGGGAYVSGSTTMFSDCYFLSNIGAYGGAINGSPSTDIIRCQFINNGGEAGGAVNVARLLCDCLFRDNSGHFGGAVNQVDAMIQCVLFDNHAQFNGGGARNIDLAINCLFSGNSTEGRGGAVFANGATLINCTLIGNRITDDVSNQNGGAAVAVTNSSALLVNCSVWDNRDVQEIDQGAQIDLVNASIDIRNSCVQGWTGSLGGIGNHGNDPRFVDADGPDNIYGTADDDPRLRPNSLCIDSGDSALLPPDQFDLDEDGDFTEPLPIDLDGLPRVIGASVDIGAFEFRGTPCRADIDGSGAVNVTDLLAIINAWGPCTHGQQCNADLDLDGQVAVTDLLAVIFAWGGCP